MAMLGSNSAFLLQIVNPFQPLAGHSGNDLAPSSESKKRAKPTNVKSIGEHS
jgi:hypothetical protein